MRYRSPPLLVLCLLSLLLGMATTGARPAPASNDSVLPAAQFEMVPATAVSVAVFDNDNSTSHFSPSAAGPKEVRRLWRRASTGAQGMKSGGGLAG